jgi:excinuclease UvrABC ATPase subunit
MAGYSRTPGVTADNNSAGNVEPGAGEEGGKIVVSGTPKDVVKREKAAIRRSI